MRTALVALFSAAGLWAQTDAAGVRAFHDVAGVLTSPRCLNCHVAGDAPLQGDDNHVHNMLVSRGNDGKGTSTMRCTNCHQTTNSTSLHGPPGAPGWSMPKASVPMAWQGLSTGDLCRLLKDPARNGNRTMNALIEHVETENLVLWGWSPGPGRTPPPLSHADFVARFKEWAAAGAPCPQ